MGAQCNHVHHCPWHLKMVHSKVGLHLGIFTYQHFYDAGLLISCYSLKILHWKFGQTSYFAWLRPFHVLLWWEFQDIRHQKLSTAANFVKRLHDLAGDFYPLWFQIMIKHDFFPIDLQCLEILFQFRRGVMLTCKRWSGKTVVSLAHMDPLFHRILLVHYLAAWLKQILLLSWFVEKIISMTAWRYDGYYHFCVDIALGNPHLCMQFFLHFVTSVIF